LPATSIRIPLCPAARFSTERESSSIRHADVFPIMKFACWIVLAFPCLFWLFAANRRGSEFGLTITMPVGFFTGMIWVQGYIMYRTLWTYGRQVNFTCFSSEIMQLIFYCCCLCLNFNLEPLESGIVLLVI
jgi:hypothetical protein